MLWVLPPDILPAMGFINLILTLLVIGFLVAHVPQKYWDIINPSSPGKKAHIKEVKKQPDRARQVLWDTLGQEVSTACSVYISQNGQKPARFEDLGSVGVDTGKKDPWGGKLHLKGNQLRSTANPDVAYKVW